MTKLAAALAAPLLFCTGVLAAEPWQVTRRIADFDRFDLMPPDAVYAVRKRGELRVEGACVTGGAECDLGVPETGWYELLAEPEGGLNEFIIDGKFGRAVRLDGKTARILLQGADANGLNLKDFTLSVWVNAESVTERKGVISRQKGPAGYALFFWNGSVAAEAGSREGSTQCRTHDSLCRAGAWHHLAATVESGKAITLYVDGKEVKRSEMKQPAGATDAPFLIGWNGWGGRQNDPSPGPFVGLVDELRVWDRVLSADEVLAEAAYLLNSPAVIPPS